MQPLALQTLQELEEFVQEIKTYQPMKYLLMIMGPKEVGKTTIFNVIIQNQNNEIQAQHNMQMQQVDPGDQMMKNVGGQSIIDLDHIVEFSQKNAQKYFEQISILKISNHSAILLVIRADRIDVEEISFYLRQIQHCFQLELDELKSCLDSVQLIITHYEDCLHDQIRIKFNQPQMQYFFDKLLIQAIYFNKIKNNNWRPQLLTQLGTKLRGQLKYSSLKQKSLNLEFEKTCLNYLNSNFQVIVKEINENLFNLILFLESTFNQGTKSYFQNLQKDLSGIYSIDQLSKFYLSLTNWLNMKFIDNQNFNPITVEVINRVTQLYQQLSGYTEISAPLLQLQLFQAQLQFLLTQDSSCNLQKSQEILNTITLSLDLNQINYIPIFLFGKSRVGKSTIANILAGQNLQCKRTMGKWVLESDNPIFDIRHDEYNCTMDACSENIEISKMQFTIIDLPGYDMDQDKAQQFKNYLNINQLLAKKHFILIVVKHDIFDSINDMHRLRQSFQDYFQSSFEARLQDIFLITTRGNDEVQQNLIERFETDINQQMWLSIVRSRLINFEQVKQNSYQSIIQQFKEQLLDQIQTNISSDTDYRRQDFQLSENMRQEFQQIITYIQASINIQIQLFFIQIIRIFSENCQYNNLKQQLQSLLIIIEKNPKQIIENNKDYIITLFAQLQQWIKNYSLDIQFSHRLDQKLKIGNCLEKLIYKTMPDYEFINLQEYIEFVRAMLNDLEIYSNRTKTANILAVRFQMLANLVSISLCVITFGGEVIASTLLAKGLIRLVGGVTTDKAVSSIMELTANMQNTALKKHVQKLIDKIQHERSANNDSQEI